MSALEAKSPDYGPPALELVCSDDSSDSSDGDDIIETVSPLSSPLRPGENFYERKRRHRIERNRVELYKCGVIEALEALCGVAPTRKPRAPRPVLEATRRSIRFASLPAPRYEETPGPQVSTMS